MDDDNGSVSARVPPTPLIEEEEVEITDKTSAIVEVPEKVEQEKSEVALERQTTDVSESLEKECMGEQKECEDEADSIDEGLEKQLVDDLVNEPDSCLVEVIFCKKKTCYQKYKT